MSKLIFPTFALAFCTMMIQAIEVRSLEKRVAFLEYLLIARQIDAAVEAIGNAHKFSTDLVIEKMRVQAESAGKRADQIWKAESIIRSPWETKRRHRADRRGVDGDEVKKIKYLSSLHSCKTVLQ